MTIIGRRRRTYTSFTRLRLSGRKSLTHVCVLELIPIICFSSSFAPTTFWASLESIVSQFTCSLIDSSYSFCIVNISFEVFITFRWYKRIFFSNSMDVAFRLSIFFWIFFWIFLISFLSRTICIFNWCCFWVCWIVWVFKIINKKRQFFYRLGDGFMW